MNIYDILEDIKDRLLSNIPVFNTGYSYARFDQNIGLTVTAGNQQRYVSLNDTEGDYFYIRVPEKINVVASNRNTADCSVAVERRVPCSLISAVKEADEFLLCEAIMNELLKTKVIVVTSQWIDPVAIVGAEFKGLNEKSINAAKARIGERTIVRIDFEVQVPFQTNNCEYQICRPC